MTTGTPEPAEAAPTATITDGALKAEVEALKAEIAALKAPAAAAPAPEAKAPAEPAEPSFEDEIADRLGRFVGGVKDVVEGEVKTRGAGYKKEALGLFDRLAEGVLGAIADGGKKKGKGS